MTNRSRRVVLAVSTLLVGACAGRQYDVAPVPRAGDGAAPVKAQVRHVRWIGQPEDSDLAKDARVSFELDVYNAGARAISVGAPVLLVSSARGGPNRSFGVEVDDQPSPVGELAPRETRTIWVTFKAPDDESLRGPLRLALVVPVMGQAPLEIVVAVPVPGGPRWLARSAPLGVYLSGGTTYVANMQVFEPFGVSFRVSHGRWIFGLGASYSWVYQQALAGGPPGTGVSPLAQVTWQPWRWSLAPYLEAGALLGGQPAPASYRGEAESLALPRLGAGVLFTFGPRLGAPGALPFDRPLSPQRRLGVRLGYTRWFNVGGAGGEGGIQISLEAGFHP